MTRLHFAIDAATPYPPEPPRHEYDDSPAIPRREVNAMGHQFDDRLDCVYCGADWTEHQAEPEGCPNHAAKPRRGWR